jgi:hypothetical protein
VTFYQGGGRSVAKLAGAAQALHEPLFWRMLMRDNA